jgi:RNA polymerase sigma-70 factor (ECF subfamily)
MPSSGSGPARQTPARKAPAAAGSGGAATAEPPTEPSGPGDDLATRLVAELPALTGIARSLVRDPDEAADLAQETLVTAWRRRAQLRDPAALRGWLRRILLNRVVDAARARRPTLDIAAVEEEWRDERFTVDPELVVERAELRDELEDALARLPVIYRLAVVLHDVHGWPAGEIAATLGIGEAAVKQRLRRGRMLLVSALAAEDAKRRASLAQPLRCWQARRAVSAYLDGELAPPAAAALEEHLATCPTCPPLYAALAGVRATLGSLRDPDTVVDAETAARIAARIGAEVRRRPGRPAGGRARGAGA